MHSNVGSHAAKSVALVTTDRAPEGLDSLMGVHMTLSGAGRRTNGTTDRASPAASRTAGAGMTAARFYHRLRQAVISH